MTASGEKLREGTEVYAYAPNRSYEITVKLEGVSDRNVSGIRMGKDGIVTDGKNVFFSEAPAWRARHSVYPINYQGVIWLKIVNFRKDLSFYYSLDGENWQKFSDSIRSHDSYRYSLFATGEGKVNFKEFKYQGLEK